MAVARAAVSILAPSPVILVSSVCGVATVSTTSMPASRSTRTWRRGGTEVRVRGAGAAQRPGGRDLVGGDWEIKGR